MKPVKHITREYDGKILKLFGDGTYTFEKEGKPILDDLAQHLTEMFDAGSHHIGMDNLSLNPPGLIEFCLESYNSIERKAKVCCRVAKTEQEQMGIEPVWSSEYFYGYTAEVFDFYDFDAKDFKNNLHISRMSYADRPETLEQLIEHMTQLGKVLQDKTFIYQGYDKDPITFVELEGFDLELRLALQNADNAKRVTQALGLPNAVLVHTGSFQMNPWSQGQVAPLYSWYYIPSHGDHPERLYFAIEAVALHQPHLWQRLEKHWRRAEQINLTLPSTPFGITYNANYLPVTDDQLHRQLGKGPNGHEFEIHHHYNKTFHD